MENGLNIAKRGKLALRLLNEGKSSFHDIAQIMIVGKCTLIRIGNAGKYAVPLHIQERWIGMK